MRRAAACLIGCLGALAASPVLLACPVCFQVEHSATTDGVRAAVIVLMSVTAAVLSGFVAFGVRVSRGSDPMK